MAKKKKNMTPAQAAAARREDARPKRKPLPSSVKDNGPRDRGNRFVLIVTALVVVIGAIAAFALFPAMMGRF